MIAMVLAQMGDDGNHMGGGWWWVMGIGWLVFLALIVLLVVFFVRQSADRGQHHTSRGAEDVLADRFARGEIDEDEYRRRRDALRG
jgi:putative membrane protein